jgi:acyl-homoserine-lactone acylase
MYNNNRSVRVTEIMKGKGKMNYDEFKQMKFDQQFPVNFHFLYAVDSMLNLSAADYPLLNNVINNFQQWDRKAEANSKGAAVFLLIYEFLAKKLSGSPARLITKAESIETFQYVHDYMMANFKTTNLVLGDIQKLVRGDDVRPAWGLPDVLTAAYTEPYKNGMRRVYTGDAYICFVRYPKLGLPIIESVNTYGASSKPGSPHFKDQMELFQKQQLKQMTLDKTEVLRKAVKIYHPVL